MLWLCCWRNVRRLLIGIGCFAALIALFYVEEDLRGKWAWEKFKREWEAKGEKFDFASLVPPTVPDDQNFALTPIVVSCYSYALDRNGHEIKPRRTDVVNRLEMSLRRTNDNYLANTNVVIGSWQKAKFTDLKPWQDYYRTMFVTNLFNGPPEESRRLELQRYYHLSPGELHVVGTNYATIYALATNEFPIAPQPQTPAADVLLALSKYDSAIEELRQASRLPYSRFPLNYGNDIPPAILIPHLSALRSCTLVLQMRSIAELQNGESDKAMEDIKLALRLADSITTEPFLISQSVRIALVNATLQPIWESLARHKWSDTQLVELDRELVKLDFLVDFKSAMRGETASACEYGDYMRRHPREFPFNYLCSDYESLPPFWARVIWYSIPSGWFYQFQLHCARFMVENGLPIADLEHRTISPASAQRAESIHELEGIHRTPFNMLELMVLPNFDNAARKFANVQVSVDLARVAIALERYRLANGEYPESIDTLAPQFITKIPHDIINGQPLHYRRTNDGQFILYSVGWNATDDGGVVGLRESGSVDIKKGDWVWRYPAK